ncbi:MAG: SLBB domain-containing protein [Desulfovibrio sp.]|jgi:protein involved in polysaccharide export with SLBB domain|nr:SLBB domain-containing protein [Desulfovibrio sp.]
MRIALHLLPLLLMLIAAPCFGADALQPYGANLFQGNFSKGQGTDAVAPGDRFVLRMWGGGFNQDGVVAVSDRGTITLDQLGELPVAGLTREKLMQDVQSKLAAAGKSDVQVYVAPLDAKAVSVLVTGGVVRPGRYEGAPNDGVLTFLDKAGGIDPERGSYRSVRLLRGGAEIETVDLYPFVRQGTLPALRLQDGDTLVVDPRGTSVAVTGEVTTKARFEFPKDGATGAALMDLARPKKRATHVSLSGTRKGAPHTAYLPVEAFRALQLEDGDKVEVQADATADTMTVEVQGAIRGASRFPVKKGSRLADVLHFIAVEPGQANLDAVHIKRKSVAAKQKKAIAESLRRLEETALTAGSSSTEEAQIRAKEAEMVTKFVERAKNVEPEGIVVLGKGETHIVLEDGDVIVIPAKSDVVMVGGEVMSPQALLWNKGRDLDDYVKGAGGYTPRADRNGVLVVHQNGAVSRGGDDIRPGDQLLVLPKAESKSMQTVKDISQVLMQVAISTRAILGLSSL